MRLCLTRIVGFILICFVGWQATGQDDYKLEEVVVTAEKRVESLQEISQAVTALGSEHLERYNIQSFVDLNSMVPGLSVSKNEGTRLVMSIRGVGNEANQNAIANPSVSFHVDGVYMASSHAALAQLLDVERLEVLRGPQGTLFGQNATGGAINVITNKPQLGERSGRLRLRVGSYDAIETYGSIDLPIGEGATLRLSGATNKHAGYSKNILLDQEQDDANNIGVRLRLYAELSENLTIDLAAQSFINDRLGPAQKGILDPTPNPRELRQDYPSSWDLKASFFSAIVEATGQQLTFKSFSSLQDDSLLLSRDNDRNDLGSLPPFTILPAIYDPWYNRQKTITQEFQLTSVEPIFKRVHWIAGYFYLNTDVDVEIREYIDFGADGTFDPISISQIQNFELGDYGFISDSNPKRNAHSIYFEASLDIDLATRLIGGLRLSDDQVESEVTNFYGRGGTDLLQIESEALTGRISLERDLNPNAMLYVSLVEGFKPGGSNLTYGREDVIAPRLVLPTYEQETVRMIETGLKSDFLSGKLRMNGALFSYDYRNMQYQATDPEVFEGGVANVPESQISGAEVEIFALLTSRLDVEFRMSLTNSEITSSHRSLDNVASDATTNALLGQGFALFGPEIQQARAEEIVNVKGNQLAKTPKSTMSLALNHVRELGGTGQITTSINVLRRGEFQYRIFNNPDTDLVGSYSVLNAKVGFEPSEGTWRAFLDIQNLLDKDGVNSRFTDVFGVGASSEELIPPRRIFLGWEMVF